MVILAPAESGSSAMATTYQSESFNDKLFESRKLPQPEKYKKQKARQKKWRDVNLVIEDGMFKYHWRVIQGDNLFM